MTLPLFPTNLSLHVRCEVGRRVYVACIYIKATGFGFTVHSPWSLTLTFLRCRLAVPVPARFKLLYSSMLWTLYARPHARCIRPSSRVTLSSTSTGIIGRNPSDRTQVSGRDALNCCERACLDRLAPPPARHRTRELSVAPPAPGSAPWLRRPTRGGLWVTV